MQLKAASALYLLYSIRQFHTIFLFVLAGIYSSNGRRVQVAMGGISNWHLGFAVGKLNADAYPHVC